MQPKKPIRFVTAASLFDGHDAAINIMRRILQSEGAEVIHLGHNRAAQAVVKAAIEEDAIGIAVSSYQGGHIEYFTYMLDLLKQQHASHIKIFGGGGGVIVKDEIDLLERRGIKKIFSPDDGITMGLVGMIQFMLKSCDEDRPLMKNFITKGASIVDLGRTISTFEIDEKIDSAEKNHLLKKLGEEKSRCPIVGITGTGGAGKSSLIDEFILRFLFTFKDKKIAVLSVDPTRAKTGGSLLGDRIRMNTAENDRVFVRSMATRSANTSIAKAAFDTLHYLASCDFDLVILETAGIGQSDQSVKELADVSVYVMTAEYGASSQLEKINMLDVADIVAINKFDKPGSIDALRDVQKTVQRNHRRFSENLDDMPVFGTCAHIFSDLGTNRFFNRLLRRINENVDQKNQFIFTDLAEGDPATIAIIPRTRSRYLSEVAETIRGHHRHVEKQAQITDRIEAIDIALKEIGESSPLPVLSEKKATLMANTDDDLNKQVDHFLTIKNHYDAHETTYEVRQKQIVVKNFYTSLSHIDIPKVKVPPIYRRSDAIRFVGLENLPGFYPFTAGVFPFKRHGEDPTRMFAGEGSPERTNKRFHYLSLDHKATRLSTAFDSVTLYGENPDTRPDIYGKVGNAGVSVCSLDDAKRLYSGFDLTSETTSVSMTINGPAPTILAFFFNAAIDFEVEKVLRAQGKWAETEKKIEEWFIKKNLSRPIYRAERPEGHNGIGIGFLGLPSHLVVPTDFYNHIKSDVLKKVRGTIQADILKEDQAQNTCIFSTEFSLRMMGDVEEYFIANNINNFYSVSVSGYHIAEAGANPISQLAFTLANGFTLLEYYRSRGMDVNDCAKNFSFFFSNGIDPEYAVIGRVARRIWAIALKNIYQANDRSQKLKYHIQTSGRSLHSQEMAFNDIRTTLQALYAIADNCNSLHTNAFDEAITTPTESSVRRAVAIQMIINHELGLTKNENPWQGSYFLEYLTNEVEKAVLKIFDNLDARGGVLGAMETMYQRSTIQEESLFYEEKKHTGELPIVGINMFVDNHGYDAPQKIELMRSTEDEKNMQVEQINQLKNRFVEDKDITLAKLKDAALKQENTFVHLMEAAKYATLGEISQAFFAVGGAYRRAM